MSLFVSATALRQATSRISQIGLGQRSSGSEVSTSSFAPATAPAPLPGDPPGRVGLAPSVAQFLSQLTPSSAAADQGTVEAASAKAAGSDPTTSGDAHLSSVFASLEADLADLVSGLGAGGAGSKAAAGADPAARAKLHDLLRALDANSAARPPALTGSALG